MGCPTCGLAIAPGTTACQRCGAQLAQTASDGWTPPHAPQGAAQGTPQSAPGAYPTAQYGPPSSYGYGPPSPYGYGYGVPFPQYRPSEIGHLGKAATILLGALAVGQAVQAAISLSGGSASPVSVLTALVMLALVPVFVVWFYRVRKNARLWGPQSRSQYWSIWAWVTPAVHLWFPIQIMRDAWRSSTDDPAAKKTVAGLTAAWWACWCLGWVTSFQNQHVMIIGPEGTPVQSSQFRAYLGGTAVSSIFTAASAVFLLLVIVRITRMQEVRIAQRGGY